MSRAVYTWYNTDPEATEAPAPGFLWTIAYRKLRAEARSEASRRSRERRWGSTEPDRSASAEPTVEARITADEALAECFEDTLVRLEAHLPREQAAILRPWLKRNRGEDGYLEPLMAATDMDEDEARAALPTVKGRLRKTLRRNPKVKEAAERFQRLMTDVDDAGLG